MSHATAGERSIFLEAIEIASAEGRAAYLDAACGDDPMLRARVEDLLRAHERPLGLLDAPNAAEPTADPGPLREGPGTFIGPYKLLEVIGEGGMGVVYMAEQTRPVRRKVALKVIKPGTGSHQVIARFDAERQALALMDHPNIARVLDAGATESGRPYFVMELVRGVPITEYCDRERLPISDRLDLFVLVCQAVQHAHQKGVIHRDLKPSNVLVGLYDDVPVPKVIDFGVAKATGPRLTEATLFTGFGAIIGTPEYMSPEQAQLDNLDIDTRSDIYSLGVLLYELLTGSTPLDRKRFPTAAPLETLQLVREEEPPRPSTRLSTTEDLTSIAASRSIEPRRLTGLVRGELDWIVMKALEKDRRRRYETAGALAADVMRHQTDRPVEARPASAWYQFTKFARRRRGVLTTASLVGLALVAGTGVSTWQAIRAQEAARASRFESLTQQILRVRLIPHSNGWSDQAWELVRQASRIPGQDRGELQMLALGVLQGLDARVEKSFSGFGASSVRFHPSGKTLLMGGCTDPKYRSNGQLPASLWEEDGDRTVALKGFGKGPVGFLPGDAPVQLVAGRPGAPIALRGLTEGQTLREYAIVASLSIEDEDVSPTAMTADGSVVGACVTRADGRRSVAVWDGPSGTLLHNLAFPGRCLVIAPDRTLVASADVEGTSQSGRSRPENPWPLRPRADADPLPDAPPRTTDQREALRPPGARRLAPRCWRQRRLRLRLGPRPWRAPRELHRELLGPLRRRVLARRHDAGHERPGRRDHLGREWRSAFASAERPGRDELRARARVQPGRRPGRGWGRRGLRLPGSGSRLRTGRPPRAPVTLGPWDSGADGEPFLRRPKDCALSADWRIGVFDRDSGRCLRLIDAPVGTFADNAVIAFSADGKRLAFASGRRAKLWDLETGGEAGSWTLPEGLGDRLAFPDGSAPILSRIETVDGVPPYSEYPPKDHPRTCRVRRLVEGGRTELIREVKDHPFGVSTNQLTPDGAYLVVGGWAAAGHKGGTLQILDLRTGERTWSRELGEEQRGMLDPTGKLFASRDQSSPDHPVIVVEVPYGKHFATLRSPVGSHLDSRYWIKSFHPTHDSKDERYSLMEQGRDDPLLRIDPELLPGRFYSNPDGRHLAWGRDDGSVAVLDLHEIRRRLAEVGLGW
jgi:serine/threonine protein kinase/WD40 repeat protein